jgi:hypothetical protein
MYGKRKGYRKAKLPDGEKRCSGLAQYFACVDDGLATLFDLCEGPNDRVSFRAAWVLEHILLQNPHLHALCLSRITAMMPAITRSSSRRHFSKLLKVAFNECARKRFPRDGCRLLERTDMEPIVECCFEWLMDNGTKPAVKVHCMDILTALSARYGWIADELPHVVEMQLLDASPGLRNKALHVLETLRRNSFV